jgi:hypothetical protein
MDSGPMDASIMDIHISQLIIVKDLEFLPAQIIRSTTVSNNGIAARKICTIKIESFGQTIKDVPINKNSHCS